MCLMHVAASSPHLLHCNINVYILLYISTREEDLQRNSELQEKIEEKKRFALVQE